METSLVDLAAESDRDEAYILLLAARKDWRALSGMRDETIFADEIFGFHAQQAVEKTLKAWLALCGVAYPRTHDISLLLSVLRMQEQDVEEYDRHDLSAICLSSIPMPCSSVTRLLMKSVNRCPGVR